MHRVAAAGTTERTPKREWRRLVGRIRARLPVYLADLRDDPKWLIMFIAGRVVALRRAAAWLSRQRVDPVQGGTLFPTVDPVRVVDELRQNGLYRGLQLPPGAVEAFASFAARTQCYGDFDRDLAFLPATYREAHAQAGRPLLVGHYLDGLDHCAIAAAVSRDPVLLGIAALYLRAVPKVISSRMWWSFPTRGYDDASLRRASQDRFHYDLNDWRSVKFFFYLTEVAGDTGPHVYVLGSHRKRRLRHQITPFVGKSHADIISFYGAENIVTILGGAGYGFVEDPFGFHMGTVATGRPRLVFEVEYGVSTPTRRRYYGEQTPRRAAALPMETPLVQ